jgi:hypothetical protein
MSSTPRRLLIAATALTALGAGATPALAAPSNPLVTYLAQQTPKLRETVGGVGSRAEELRTITEVTRNQRAVNAAIHVVEHLPTEAVQQTGKKTWLEGERYQARADSQTAAGLRLILTGHRSTGAGEVNRQWRRNGNFYLFDHYNAFGLRELRVPAS